jgi:Flp pilus assembly protein CpaB
MSEGPANRRPTRKEITVKPRGLVVAVAVVLAAAAAAFVLLYTNGVKKEAVSGGELSVVIVPNEDVPANTKLTPLVDDGVFSELRIPKDAVVDGAITTTDALRGQTTTSPILKNEQVSTHSLSSGEAPTGGGLGITKGNVALSIQLEAQHGVYGNVSAGDNVTVYATFNGVSAIKGDLKQLLNNPSSSTTQQRVDLPDFTVTLIPTVRVLSVVNPGVDENGNQEGGSVVLTLDLQKQDAQNLVFAQQNAQVWVGLLPPGEEGQQLPPSTVPVNLLIGKKAA